VIHTLGIYPVARGVILLIQFHPRIASRPSITGARCDGRLFVTGAPENNRGVEDAGGRSVAGRSANLEGHSIKEWLQSGYRECNERSADFCVLDREHGVVIP